MKNILFAVSGYLICLNLSAQNFEDVNKQVFVADKAIEILAQQYDSIYFPLFLKSFDWIKHEDTAKIREYFAKEICLNHNKKAINLADPATLKIKIIYKFKNYALEDYPLNPPILWTDEINTDPSWRLWFQSLTWLEPYLKSSNSDSANAAFYVINDWITSHLNYPVKNEQFAFDDHAVAERLLIMVKAYHRYEISDVLDTGFENRLLLSILNHIFFVSSLEKYLCWHNHAIIFDERLITSLANLPEFKLNSQVRELAYLRIFEQYRYGFTGEGIHKEHSPCYHKTFAEKLNYILLTAGRHGISIPENILELQSKANLYSSTIKLFGNNITMGDCSRSQSPMAKIKDPTLDYPVPDYAVNNNGSGFNEIAKGSSLFTRMIFPNTGWVYFYNKINEIFFVSQSDFFGFSHYQKDETSFILNKSGHELIIDPGLYSYARSPVYDFYRSAQAHNVLLVDNLDFDIDYDNTGLSGITRFYPDTGNCMTGRSIIEMTHPHYRKLGVEIYRQFVLPAGNLVVIKDIISSNTSHDYYQLLHLAPGAIIDKKGKEYRVTWLNLPFYLRIASNEDEYTVVSGQKDPLQGWYFPAFNQIAEAPVLVFKKKGTNCEFITKIEVCLTTSSNEKRHHVNKTIKFLENRFNEIERSSLVHAPFPKNWEIKR